MGKILRDKLQIMGL